MEEQCWVWHINPHLIITRMKMGVLTLYSFIRYHADDGKVFAGDGQGVVAPIHHQVGIGKFC